MKIILLQEIPGVGRKYEVKNVADGYATNFLIPRKLAEFGTPEALSRAAKRQKNDETERQIQTDLLSKNLAALEGAMIEIAGKGNEQGHLFAAIHQEAIAQALKEQKGIDVLPEFIHLSKPVKEVGEHSLEVEANGKKVKFVLQVKAA